MKKTLSLFAIAAVAAVALMAPMKADAQQTGAPGYSGSIVSLDIGFANAYTVTPIPFKTTNTLSKTVSARPLWLNVWGADPGDGTLTFGMRHKDAKGTWRNQAFGTMTLVQGALHTNLNAVVDQLRLPPAAKGDTYYFDFSTACTGSVQLVGELLR